MEEHEGIQAGILLMDADPARAARRCGQLACQKWRVSAVADKAETLQALQRGRVDLVLMHLSMTDAEEMELPQAVHRAAGSTYLPVVVLAEQSKEIQRCRMFDGGVDEILPDTVGAAELHARLKALLRIKELQDALQASRQALQSALQREHELLQKLRADNDQLEQMVMTDPLTRLHNVRYFQRFFQDEFKIARRYGHALGLLALDLDHFKLVNDRYGHPAGDYVLKEMGVILRQQVRESDVVARTGGEEFAVILPRADRIQSDHFARRIRESVAAHPFVFGGASIKVTCSIGAASYPQDADVTGPESLAYFADQALLVAKQSGRNCVVHWFEMDKQLKARLRVALNHFEVPSESSSQAVLTSP